MYAISIHITLLTRICYITYYLTNNLKKNMLMYIFQDIIRNGKNFKESNDGLTITNVTTNKTIR